MRFKREDIGLYVATALIGGGLGLLAGAFLTARINKKREEDFNAEDAARDESEIPIGEDEVIMSIDSEDIARGSTFPTKEDVAKHIKIRPEDNTPLLTEEKAWPVKKTESHRLSKEDRDELARLTREYTVGALQIGLVERGTMSVEELEEALIDLEIDQTPLGEDEDLEEGLPQVDYSKQYRGEDKPDMEDLLDRPIDDVGPREWDDLLVTVGGRWEILLEPPKGKPQSQKRIIYFDSEDEGVYTRSKAGDMTPADLRVMISKEVREIIMPWLLFEESLETIYVDDIRNKKTRWYEIVRLKEDDNDEYQ